VKKGLGRGLGALLDMDREELRKEQPQSKTGVLLADIRNIEPSENQPRKFFDESALTELAESIKNFGVIQPLIVKDNGGYYSIIAGERRFRAARLAKLTHVPVIIKEYTETDTLQIALIENIQRQDLTPIEEAACYKRLVEDYFFSPEEIAQKVGKNKHNVQNMLLLLDLDEHVQGLAADGLLTASHGRLLLAVSNADAQFELAQQIIERELSVRQTETLIKNYLNQKEKTILSEDAKTAYRRAEDELKNLFGAKVNIKPGKKKSRIEIEYYSTDELERLLRIFKRLPTHTNFV
jgi:ParB family chromosome partitioning protein